MRTSGIGPALPFAAVIAASGAAPLFGVPWSAALGSAAALLLVGVAWLVLQLEWRLSRLAAGASAAGLLGLALGAGFAQLPGAPPWIVAAAAAPGAVVLAWGQARSLRAWARCHDARVELLERLARREADVRAQAERIRRLDLVDAGTGLLNRRGLATAMARALADATEHGAPLALLLVELPAQVDPGERIGRKLGQAVQQSVRGSDLAGRWDAGLLAVLLPRCEDHRPALRRLAASLAAASPDGSRLAVIAGVTVAAGGPCPDAEGLVAAGLAALNAARRAPPAAEPVIWPLDWGLAALAGLPPGAEHDGIA
ncbi:MAG: diguanylate cyclase [Acidobacteria bacterium]|nr:diguanylate cyclase [Acidobacteriota bacterium]